MSARPLDETACKHCGQPLPADGDGAVCRACLMAEALQSVEEDEGDIETALPGASDGAAFERQLGRDPLEGSTLGPDGRYKILQVIGDGGFGTVYMAEQCAPVRRRVAVKVLKAGMDTRQVIARFEAERQALAMMDHPNIAKILDGGETDQGRPFFVMELVRGTPITRYCDREQLDTGTRLALFTKVCHAVQHAHQKGIIHRDLKPSNILVTAPDGAEPVPKVIDFGVAKALESNLTEKTLFTRFEQMIGTPAYMSPEQAGTEGGIDVDTRADIYALGVLLYELLAGTTPFEADTLQQAAFEELRRILREEEAPRPSARLSSLAAERRSTIAQERGTEEAGLGKLLRGDLDWIVMKAIEKDRRRRYETANALAEDVARHLADEPVSAGPPTAAYRTGKFLRRHKAPLAIAATVALLLIVGITATSWQALRATAERNRALEAEALAEERQEEAEAISEFITGIFETAKPGTEEGGRTITVEESLKIAEERLEEDAKMPETRRAVLLETIAGVYESLGRWAEAASLFKKTAQAYERASGPAHPDTLQTVHRLGHAYEALGRHEEAMRCFENSVVGGAKELGWQHPDVQKWLGCLSKAFQPQDELEEVGLALPLGDGHSVDLKDREPASPSAGVRERVLMFIRENYDITRKTSGPDHPDTIHALGVLAGATHAAGRFDEAIALREQQLNLRRLEFGPEDPQTLFSLQELAKSHSAAGQVDRALELREELLSLRRNALGPEHPDTLGTMIGLANSLDRAKRREDALEMREKLLPLSRKILGPEHENTLNAMHNLAVSLADADREEEALAMREEVLLLHRRLHPEHPDILGAMSALAVSLKDVGREEEALAMREEMLSHSLKVRGPEHPDTIATMHNLGLLLSDAGRVKEALAVAEEVLSLSRKVLGPEDPQNLGLLNNLGNFYHANVRNQDALEVRRKQLQLSRKVNGTEHPETNRAIRLLGQAYETAGQPEQKLVLWEDAVAARGKSLGPEHPDTITAMYYLAHGLHEAGRSDEAVAMGEEVLSLRRKVLGPEHSDTVGVMNNLAIYLAGNGKVTEALTMREKTLQLSRRVHGRVHETTRMALNNLGNSYHANDRNDKALEVRLEQWEVSRELHGEEHAQTRNAKSLLADAYEKVGQLEKAAELRGPGHDPVNADSPEPVAVLVSPPAEWRWLHPVDGMDPAEADPDFHRTFYRPDFDDSGWKKGTDGTGRLGGFGYGDDWFTGVDIGAPPVKGLSKAAYFRHRFTTDREHSNLELRCQRDDGIVVYLDGKEVARGNMVEGEERFDLAAQSSVGDSAETTVFRLPLEGIVLPPGEHVLAISLHNTENPSSDLRIGEISLVEVARKKAAVDE